MSIAIAVQSRLHSLRDRAGLRAGIGNVSKYAGQLIAMGARIYTANYMGISALCKELFEMLEEAPLDLVYRAGELYMLYESTLRSIAYEVLGIDSVDKVKHAIKTILDSFIDATSSFRSEKEDEISKQAEWIAEVFKRFSRRIEISRNADELAEVLRDLEQEFRRIVERLVPIYENLLHITYTLYIATGDIYMKMFSAVLYALRNLFKARISGVNPIDSVRGISCLCTATTIAVVSHKRERADPKLYRYVAAYSLWSQAFMNAFSVCERCSWLDTDHVLSLYQRRRFAESARILDIAMFSDIGVECYRHLFSVLRIDLTQALEEIREEERTAMSQREAEEGVEKSW